MTLLYNLKFIQIEKFVELKRARKCQITTNTTLIDTLPFITPV